MYAALMSTTVFFEKHSNLNGRVYLQYINDAFIWRHTDYNTSRRRFGLFSELWRNENELTMTVRETSRPADALQSIMTETAQWVAGKWLQAF